MNTVPAYQFDYSGMYLGQSVADESPREPGVFLIPARCTLVAPPAEVPDDKWPRWNGVEWELVTRPQAVAQDQATQATDDPLTKLRDFLDNNPDVAALLTATNGGANA